MQLKNFQVQAVDAMKLRFYELWKSGNRNVPLVFKSPTGSGKTIMSAEFLRRITGDMQFESDVAFVWISFNEESYMQSKKKLFHYYNQGVSNLNLLDLNDLNNGKLKRNEVFFINWQKIVSRAKDNRRLRTEGEANTTFDEFIQSTHEDGREIVLIVDESHLSKDTDLAGEVIDLINPRIQIHVSATPTNIPNRDEEDQNKAGYVSVKHVDVVAEGLIKEQIEIMPKEEIEQVDGYQQVDMDTLLLDLAMKKNDDLGELYSNLSLPINPLVLIQLPNDEKEKKDTEGQNKLAFIQEYLQRAGISEDRVAIWLSDKKENLEEITQNNSQIDFLIFKQAAATGWDCPRAQVLVMFREIKSPTFRTQVLGRVLRMPEAKHYMETPLNRAYVYTSYEQDEIAIQQNKIGSNKLALNKSYLRNDVENISLPSVFLKRGSYNDLGDTFQKTFMQAANEYFGFTDTSILQDAQEILHRKGLDISAHHITNQLIVDAKVEVYDDFIAQVEQSAQGLDHQASYHDTQKLYNLLLYREISQQTEDVRKYAPERSWGKLKTAINVWLKEYVHMANPPLYAIVCNDLEKGANSTLRPIISDALAKYKPIRNQEVQEKLQKTREPLEFTLGDTYAYTDDNVLTEAPKCAIQPVYIHQSAGSAVEKDFIEYLETQDIDWWFKNGDFGRSNLAIEYIDNLGELKAFYPDFIVKQGSRVGIFDTKGGITAETAGKKAEALQNYIKEYSGDLELWGGIVVTSGGQWLYNDQEVYQYNARDLSGWETLDI